MDERDYKAMNELTVNSESEKGKAVNTYVEKIGDCIKQLTAKPLNNNIYFHSDADYTRRMNMIQSLHTKAIEAIRLLDREIITGSND